MCNIIVCVNVDRLSVTVDAALGKAVRDAAASRGVSVSSWMSEAAVDRLRNQLLGAALDAWEAEEGAFTETELAEGARALGGPAATHRRAR